MIYRAKDHFLGRHLAGNSGIQQMRRELLLVLSSWAVLREAVNMTIEALDVLDVLLV